MTFGIILHSKDVDLLKLIRSELDGIGRIWEGIPKRVQYLISSSKELGILIAHLEKYPLLTQKWADYQLFKLAWKMFIQKQHLTVEGLNLILSIKAVMNSNGLSNVLAKAFPLRPISRPLVTIIRI